MIEDSNNHHLKKRRPSPSASPLRTAHHNHHQCDTSSSSDSCNNNLAFNNNLLPVPPSPQRLIHHGSSSLVSIELGGGGGGEEKKEDDFFHYHHGATNNNKGKILVAVVGCTNISTHRSFSLITILTALSTVLIAPLLLWDDYPAKLEVLSWLRHIELVWTALLHISIWPVVFVTAVISVLCMGHNNTNRGGRIIHHPTKAAIAAAPSTAPCLTTCHRLLFQPKSSLHYKLPLLLSILFTGLISTQSFLQMAFPSIIWNPAIWTPFWGYHVFLPRDVQKELRGGCFNVHHADFDDYSATFPRDSASYNKSSSSAVSSSSSLLRSSINNKNQPLCLSQQQWSHLSSGTLSSHNPNDVATVHRGLSYLQTQSNGLVINALARNIKESIPDLRRNIEGLVPLLGLRTKLTFVVFENDSVDGTREELRRWAEEVNSDANNNHNSHNSNNDNNSNNNNNNNVGSRYNVDLIQCPPPNTDCKLNIIDRNEVSGGTNKTSSGVGKLGDFRQIVLDHVVANYADYSHMIVLDVDLGVSVSPLGILHTLGLMSESGDSLAEKFAVASAATQIWPGTFGTIESPYDLSAFRAKPTSANSKVRTLQSKFCQLMPPGDRWRNMCDAPSPMQFFMILKNNDPMFHHGRPYEVKSAFNGITMYPLGLIRERGTGAKYDAGKDGQQCEHIGFHLSLRDTMLVNPKWKMNLKVDKPGGPNGFHVVLKVFDSMSKRPKVTRLLAAVNFISFFMFLWSVWVLSVTVKESIPSLIDYFEELRSRSEKSFLYGYWLDVTGRGAAESPSSSAVQQRIGVAEEEGKKLLS